MNGLFEIDLRSNMPIYEQIVVQVKEKVLKGYLQNGDAMPSIRSVSRDATVNPNTVARAYQELERMGLIETVVGRGTFIKAPSQPQISEKTLKSALTQLKQPLMEMKLMGLDNTRIMDEVSHILSSLEESK